MLQEDASKWKAETYNNMTRTGIFCLYAPTGNIDFTITNTLKELKKVTSKLIVAVNGNVNNMSDLQPYADEILLRENKGFDIGAYAEVILSPVYREMIKKSGELVLCNSSFYGPFIPFKAIFQKMEKSSADFWGISSSEKGLQQHIQSYFMVYRQRVLEGEELFSYLREHVEGKKIDYFSACSVFENGLFWELKKAGYKFDAYKRNIDCDNYTNPYGSVKMDGIPILKKKIFSREFYQQKQVANALSYIEKKYRYDITLILEHAHQAYGIVLQKEDIRKEIRERAKKDILPEDNLIAREEIEQFVASQEKILIYGIGGMAKRIFSCFFFYEDNPILQGFVISDGQNIEDKNFRGYPIYRYSEIEKDIDMALLVALNQDNTEEVYPLLRNRKKVKFLWKNF